jgi:hypothetical protein
VLRTPDVLAASAGRSRRHQRPTRRRRPSALGRTGPDTP